VALTCQFAPGEKTKKPALMDGWLSEGYYGTTTEDVLEPARQQVQYISQ